MRTTIPAVTAVFTLLAASTAQAQQAVQWRVQDGGNGHWYGTAEAVDWPMALVEAASRGAHLATPTSPAENQFVAQRLLTTNRSRGWIGLEQMNDQPTPDAGWHWVTGEALSWTNWLCFGGSLGCAPDDSPCFGQPWQVEDNQANCATMERNGTWDDLEKGPWCDGASRIALLEWSADCNNDGIVDYGQCRDGSLPDYDGNNIPDCCEAGSPCFVGIYPVEWRTAEGGNGHWYGLTSPAPDWHAAAAEASIRGGHLAALTSAPETHLAASIASRDNVAYIGARQDQGADEPFGGWRWITGEPWGFESWHFNMDDAPCGVSEGPGEQQFLWMHNAVAQWEDVNDVPRPGCPLESRRGIIEWSADCNGDGIVDKGQILRGQLPDTNNNGVPDGCEVATCIDADIYRDFNVNGADLGILLSQWGPNTPLTESDLNRDGAVDGVDLGILLAFWGPCP